jgi:hypothetical protein
MVSVTRTTEALSAGQLVTVAAHEVRVLTIVVRTVDVLRLVVVLVVVLGGFEWDAWCVFVLFFFDEEADLSQVLALAVL